MWRRKKDQNETGATLIEYAVVAPFLFLLLFGIVEFAVLTTSFTSVLDLGSRRSAIRNDRRGLVDHRWDTPVPRLCRYQGHGTRTRVDRRTDRQPDRNHLLQPRRRRRHGLQRSGPDTPLPHSRHHRLGEHRSGGDHQGLRGDRSPPRKVHRRHHPRFHSNPRHSSGGSRCELTLALRPWSSPSSRYSSC